MEFKKDVELSNCKEVQEPENLVKYMLIMKGCEDKKPIIAIKASESGCLSVMRVTLEPRNASQVV